MKLNKIRAELEAIKCPHCNGYDRLSVSTDGKSVYCAECGDGITAEYLLTVGFVLEVNEGCRDDSCDLSHCVKCGSHMLGCYLNHGTICDSCAIEENALANQEGREDQQLRESKQAF